MHVALGSDVDIKSQAFERKEAKLEGRLDKTFCLSCFKCCSLMDSYSSNSSRLSVSRSGQH